MGHLRCEKGDGHVGLSALEVFCDQGSSPKIRVSLYNAKILNKSLLRLRQCHSGIPYIDVRGGSSRCQDRVLLRIS